MSRFLWDYLIKHIKFFNLIKSSSRWYAKSPILPAHCCIHLYNFQRNFTFELVVYCIGWIILLSWKKMRSHIYSGVLKLDLKKTLSVINSDSKLCHFCKNMYPCSKNNLHYCYVYQTWKIHNFLPPWWILSKFKFHCNFELLLQHNVLECKDLANKILWWHQDILAWLTLL